jgi:hypothetical protein
MLILYMVPEITVKIVLVTNIYGLSLTIRYDLSHLFSFDIYQIQLENCALNVVYSITTGNLFFSNVNVNFCLTPCT